MKSSSKSLLILSLAVLLIVSMLFGYAQKKESAPTADMTEQKTYTVACEAAFAPFEMRDPQKSELIGFDMDLIRTMAKVEGFKVNIKEVVFDGIIAAVQTGNVDMSISALAITPESKQAVDFSMPYYYSGLVSAVKANNTTIKGQPNLTGKKIAVQFGSNGAKFAQTIPGAKLSQFDHVPEMFIALKNGEVDAVVNDLPVTAYYINESGCKDFKIVGDRMSSEPLGIAVTKGNSELLKLVNDGLLKLKANGEFDKIYEKWFGQKAPASLPCQQK